MSTCSDMPWGYLEICLDGVFDLINPHMPSILIGLLILAVIAVLFRMALFMLKFFQNPPAKLAGMGTRLLIAWNKISEQLFFGLAFGLYFIITMGIVFSTQAFFSGDKAGSDFIMQYLEPMIIIWATVSCPLIAIIITWQMCVALWGGWKIPTNANLKNLDNRGDDSHA